MPTGSPVVLTRESGDNEPLVLRLVERGVPVWQVPCAQTEYRAFEWPAGPFDAVAFSSRRAVRGVKLKGDLSFLKTQRGQGPTIAAVGAATGAELEKLGIRVDIVAAPPTGEQLADTLHDALSSQARVALVCAAQTTGIFQSKLATRGIEVVEIPVYRNTPPAIPQLTPRPIAAVFFAAPSAAERLFEANPWMRDYPACAIGPTTYDTLVDLGAATPRIIGMNLDEQLGALCALHDQATKEMDKP